MQSETILSNASNQALQRTASKAPIHCMKRILFVIAFSAGVACAHAQYTLIKSVDGVLVVSNVPGRRFSVDVPGSEILPVRA